MLRLIFILFTAVLMALLKVNLWAISIILLLLLIIFLTLPIIARHLESKMNRSLQAPPYKVSEETKRVHDSSFMVDLHADPLLWKRDLLKQHDYGHIDLPRLEAGGVALQVCGIVTRSPKGQNFEHNASDTFDNITLLSVLQAQPVPTWFSRYERARYQCAKLHQFAARSNGRLIVIKTASDLERLLNERRARRQLTGGLLSLEGVHGLDGKLENLNNLFDAGLRMVGMTHFFDNEAGGSAHGMGRGGLSDFGRAVVKRANEKHMVIDLAHASPAMIDDVLKISTAPVIVSHTGVKGTYESVRNLSDAHVKAIAASGGVIGIAMFEEAVGESSLAGTVRAIRYVVDLVGIDYAAIGGDLDGSVQAPVDVSGMPLLTEELLKAGFSTDEIGKILGLNAYRVLHSILPR